MTRLEPTRRQVLRAGGIAVAASAVLAACRGDDDDGQAVPDPDETPTTTTVVPGLVIGPELDVVLVNTALSLEALAVDTYQRLLGEGWAETAEVVAAIEIFTAHHGAHGDDFAFVVEEAGDEPFRTPNPVVRVHLVEPLLRADAGEATLLAMVHELEHTITQSYVHAARLLSTPELRARAMAIGAVEARHVAITGVLGDRSFDLPARYPSQNPLPDDAVVR